MKKLIGVSLIAMLAVGPLAANARDLTSEELAHAAIVASDATNVATTGYVKGAYTELGTVINMKQDKLSEAQLNAISNVAGKQDALSEAQMNAVNSGITSAKVSGYDAVESAVNDASTGLATKAAASDLTALEGRVDTAEDDIDALQGVVGDSTDGLVKDVADLQGVVGDSTDGLVKDVADNADAIAALQTASGDYATKTGVAATVNAATGSVTGVSLTVEGTPTGTVSSSLSEGAVSASVNIPTSATVTTLTTWGSSTTGTADVALTNTATAINGTVTGNVTSTFTGTGITSGTATGDITGIDVSVTGYQQGA